MKHLAESLKQIRIWGAALVLFMLVGLSATASAQTPKRITYKELEGYLKRPTDTVTVVNFWATWCKPCVHELPAFDELTDKIGNRKLRVLLVSVDFPNEHERRVFPFVKKKGLRSTVYCLNESDANKWVNNVNPDWQGDIPATLIVDGKGKYAKFMAQSFTYAQLEEAIQPFLSK